MSDAPDNVASSVQEMPAENFDQFWRRVRYSFGRAFSHGSGIFTLAMLLTAGTITAARIAVPSWLDFQRQQKDSVEFLFTSEVQTPSGDPARPIIAAITDSIRTAPPDDSSPARPLLDCDSEPNACPGLREGKLAIQDFERMINALVRRCAPDQTELDIHDLTSDRAQGPKSSSLNAFEHCRAEVDSILPPYAEAGKATPTQWTRALTTAGAHLELKGWEKVAGEMVTSCPPASVGRAEVGRAKDRTESLGDPKCDNESALGLQTLIPPQMLPAAEPTSRGILDAQILDYVVSRVRPLMRDNPQTANDVDVRPELAQAYFISVENVLRIWTPFGFDQLTTLPRNRLWSSASYFMQLLQSSRDASSTGIYLDTGDNGLVRSYCFPVDSFRINKSTEEPSNSKPHAATVPSFDGAVCFDYALPATQKTANEILKRICQITYLNLAAFSVRLQSDGYVKSVAPEMATCPGKPLLTLQASEIESTINNSAPFADAARGVTEHHNSDGTYFLIPLRRRSASEAIFLVVTSYTPRPPDIFLWSGSIALLCLCLAIALLFQLGSSRGEAKLRRHLARLRGLPIAVIEVDQKNRIVGGNDRAEEMIGYDTPKLGIASSSVRSIDFDSLFDCYAEGRLPPLTEGQKEKYPGRSANDITRIGARVLRVDLDTLRRRRERGMRSTYFARLKREPSKWIKVMASPELSLAPESMSDTWPPTFGALVEATASETQHLLILDTPTRGMPTHETPGSVGG